ncbi:50S ribosomal protein L11 methyltransferase [Salisediminibacterium halotolerans]|uniref:50S ribosomal protein L11 methyltransferase n=1 Tax=Salisediminibacterium halotolerans TaxID=517425 RepID=UPI000EB12B50|nr:50S ribosomal protein L11 methyltransferase [Salisediminibacterium halotolerans]RLJ78165.1 [LSU ribosomal protein L11P]-lysine N-methyltransferase [Actinophytocola xinjiangensis]RPE88496.1 [LSU ribosomal protein L11P]-lysine N-methyltransferase [Salisediminibacterium halotolerans]TWG37142.1 [LSU ribosomal protein L11P]-lysine N-methyltransferase [Salisediminibacterium halotolerans]GEL07280.1 ribosomal protein L11 methyltransferase [Salisediminibacterium halotolerans]
MKWSEICIHTSQEAVDPVSHILHESGASGVVIEDREDLFRERETVFGEIYDLSPEDYPEEGVLVKAYLPVNSFLKETVDSIKEAVNRLHVFDIDLGLNHVTVSEINEEEWATQWKKYYKPVKVSERITITPTWEEYTPVRENEEVIELDPGMAFGTGTHPTTVLCIQALEKHLNDGDTVTDVGCGTGVLSIASAKLGAAKVEALDLDEVAVKSAEINTKLNRVQDRVNVRQGDLLQDRSFDEKKDIIVANILAEVILDLLPDAESQLKNGGKLIVSGIIERKRSMVKEALQEAGWRLAETTEMEGWIAIVAERP